MLANITVPIIEGGVQYDNFSRNNHRNIGLSSNSAISPSRGFNNSISVLWTDNYRGINSNIYIKENTFLAKSGGLNGPLNFCLANITTPIMQLNNSK